MQKGIVESVVHTGDWNHPDYGEFEQWAVRFQGDPTSWETSSKGQGSRSKFVEGEETYYTIKESIAMGGQRDKIKFESKEYAESGGQSSAPRSAPTRSPKNDPKQKSIEVQGAVHRAIEEHTVTGAGYESAAIETTARKYYEIVQKIKASV